MKASYERVGSKTWIDLRPDEDELNESLKAILSRKPREILVDLSHCRAIGARDATHLCRHLWEAHTAGARVVLGGVSGNMRRLVTITGMADYFACHEQLPAAIAEFRASRHRFLGDLLVEAGHLQKRELDRALKAQAKERSPRRLGTILTERGHVRPASLLTALFRQRILARAA